MEKDKERNMQNSEKRVQRMSLGFLLIIGFQVFTTGLGSASDAPQILYYAVQRNGQTCGSSEVKISHQEDGGRTILVIEENSRTLVSALGASVDMLGRSKRRIEESTFREVSTEVDIDQGSLKIQIFAAVEGRTARITRLPGGGEKTVALPEDVVFENGVLSPHLKKDFVDRGATSKRYKVLDLLDRTIQEVTYTKARRETLRLVGRTWQTVVLDSFNHATGRKVRLWLDEKEGWALKAEGPRSVATLADKSELEGLRRASLDNSIFAKTKTSISDIPALAFMKVKASLEPVGNPITAQSLNVPGQTFQGAVTNNQIEGIFEIRHAKYDGRDAPPFPPNYGRQPGLRPFLEPEDYIESDDPVLIKKAKELTAGAKDSWEAAKRLSRWVAETIGYDIPGGASARNTYDLKEGECGAHSRLYTAFARAVGIPARVVWGCLYLSNAGGGFGQHAWNEVYMGTAGWIPIDTTAREVDYADAGHIRLGILSSSDIAWNPKNLEILDFQVEKAKGGQASELDIMKKYGPYLGKYRGRRGVMTVHVQNGGLAVTFPDGRDFELRDPDEKGFWFFKLTKDVNLDFDEWGEGRIAGFMMMNRVRLPKRADLAEVPSGVPEKVRAFLGHYPIPMEKRDITVSYRGGRLVAELSGEGVWELEGPDAEGQWTTKGKERLLSFILDESGNVKTMVLTEMIHYLKI
jgi:transglutaminase-like putative cysteine protease